MKVVGPNKAYIDYFQGPWCSQKGLSTRLGIRVRQGLFRLVVKFDDGQENVSGKEYCIPVELGLLPSHLRMIVDAHGLNYPASDLIDVLTGKTSFQQALDSPPKIDPQRATEIGPQQFPAEQSLQRKSGK